MIHIIGGSKVALNLYQILKKNKIKASYYYFDKCGRNKKGGLDFFQNQHKLINSHPNSEKLIISSETAFVNLPSECKKQFNAHYFLRNKNNFSLICNEIACKNVDNIDINKKELKYPIFVKPHEFGLEEVNFRLKILKNENELNEIKHCAEYCIFQPYLSQQEYNQYAIAGYYTGNVNSLIVVKQLSQFPMGTSAFVMQDEEKMKLIKEKVAAYLTQIKFIGFIELEFKCSKDFQDIFLIDINPRLWGWCYYYISAVKNIEEVIFNNATPVLKMKKYWINPYRMFCSMFKRNFKAPSLRNVIKNEICYEPMF